jgi:hypothetical protein
MTVQGFISTLPKKQKDIMTMMRLWILDLGPHVKEELINNIPSFHLNGALCYISHDEDSVSLCFNRGFELPKEYTFLESKGRKHVMSATFYGVTELDEYENEVKELLNEAAALNGFLARKRK